MDLTEAPADGPVAFGGTLDAATLLGAYRAGLFPFPAADPVLAGFNEARWAESPAPLVGGDDPYALAWWSPDPRPVLAVDRLRERPRWTCTVGRAFDRVLEECRRDRQPRWLTDELAAALRELHRDGQAVSGEVWEGEELVGGAYGIRVGPVLSLDSMFHHRPGSGTAALAGLAARFAAVGGRLLDVQWDSPHIRSLGAELLPRERYLAALGEPDTQPLG
ncbi:leucyl/phenylalanyl-tRNA--protein transferase [Kitasatospora gansuensis]|uniref:Leucyl/phenylalanyl-tRNA--protein transferase n=1 Tax=Kitasatospora gansuensis TaxID=258050 RepID=A0A7W7WGT0_9ACTN|nr:leucyl/phenylalanyl-tRNA--protein transferase [Kitasatospora gansuensis]MBB4945930.1 leucyl/phenylalanyl-tRNA--protein transferase [Kitasatospora gansuensis]